MPAIESVAGAVLTEALDDDSALNPNRDDKNAVVHITLRFQDVTFDPSDVYDALNAKWATVTTDHINTSGRCRIYNISA